MFLVWQKRSEETKRKISEARNKNPLKGKKNGFYGKTHKKVKCEYCNKIISFPNYQRWHGEKCKML